MAAKAATRTSGSASRRCASTSSSADESPAVANTCTDRARIDWLRIVEPSTGGDRGKCWVGARQPFEGIGAHQGGAFTSQSDEAIRQRRVLGEAERVETEPDVPGILALEQPIGDRQAVGVVDRDGGGIQGAEPDAREEVGPVAPVDEHRHDEPGGDDHGHQHREEDARRCPSSPGAAAAPPR